ncbi:MAG: GGDEF domain-containing protein [Gemmatimonadaceae bacterium]|nr:GGDEF domain-containing protein [Gemmatimonadaceae bacterium]
MDAHLWRWSTAVQITSALLIALFFDVLMRSTRRVELRAWVAAWLANLFATVTMLAYWMPAAQTAMLLKAARFPYLFFKSSFIVLLIAGAVGFGTKPPERRTLWGLAAALGVVSLVVGVGVRSLDMLGVLMSATIAAALGGAALQLIITRQAACGWLAVGFAMRGMLALAEGIAHNMLLTGGAEGVHRDAATFVAMSSAFDAGAEWLIALGCVLAVYGRIGTELTRRNSDLLTTKDELRSLSHRDPLTGVFNRRRLADILNDSRLTGATILFFDLDDFKDINDVHGHHVGDEALQHFARVLQASFRPDDHVIRYAGDEFIVVGQGIAEIDVAERITVVRDMLQRERAGGPVPLINFAVGESYMPVGGDPDAAVRAADAAMYRRKGETKRPA